MRRAAASRASGLLPGLRPASVRGRALLRRALALPAACAHQADSIRPMNTCRRFGLHLPWAQPRRAALFCARAYMRRAAACRASGLLPGLRPASVRGRAAASAGFRPACGLRVSSGQYTTYEHLPPLRPASVRGRAAASAGFRPACGGTPIIPYSAAACTRAAGRGAFLGAFTSFPRILCKLFRLLSNFIHILPVIS